MRLSHKIILTLSAMLVAGYMWSLDMPEALEVPLREQPFNFTNFDFNLMYFSTFIAICFFDLPVGMLLDKFPIKKTVLVICFISLISQTIILLMFHFQFQGYKIFVYIFRGVFGVAGQALYTVQALIISLYGGKYYDMLIGVCMCVPFLFDSINNIVTPYIMDQTNSIDLVWGIGVIVCFITMAGGIIISIILTRQQKEKKELADNQQPKIKSQQEIQADEINFNGLKTLPRQFWVIVGAVFFTEFVIACTVDNLNDSIVKRFQIPYVTTGYFILVMFSIIAVISFVLGLILQKKPKLRRPLTFFSNIFFTIGMLMTYFLPNVQVGQEILIIHYIFISIQLFSLSCLFAILYGVLSAAIVYVVNPKNLGIAWGVIGSVIGFSQAIAPIFAAWILQASGDNLGNGYRNFSLFIFLTSLIALAFSTWILIGDFSKIDVNSCENIPTSQQESLLKQSLRTQG